MPRNRDAVTRMEVTAYRVPTDAPEADGTLAWQATTLVLVRAHAGDACGLGWTYAHSSVAALIHDTLAPEVIGADAMDVSAAWTKMVGRVRNLGFAGLCANAISAVDTALWDLKARLLGLPLVKLLGQVRESVPVYGSGGFTSYDLARLQAQLGGWAADGFDMVKMKVGTHPDQDEDRVRAARDAIGPKVRLFVDANGAYDRAQALAMAERFARHDVSWVEEPVSSDDLEGLALIRARAPAGMAVAAGEYGYHLFQFRRLAPCLDVLQADASRCGGITGFLRVAAIADAQPLPLSAHTAPALHLHVCCATPAIRHLEYFHDHARIEQMLFDGVVGPEGGHLRPDLGLPGNGLTLKGADAARYEV